jgi:protein TonB
MTFCILLYLLIQIKITMKTKKININSKNLKLLLILPVFVLGLIAFPSNATGQAKATDEPYFAVDEMPAFPGGDAALFKYVASNVQYPASARENDIEGKVIIRFCVTADGNINQISVLKSVDRDIDNEAMRVIRKLPAFKPGKKAGVAVPVWYMVPITFAINK